jgi:hypothetical protein
MKSYKLHAASCKQNTEGIKMQQGIKATRKTNQESNKDAFLPFRQGI